MAKFNSPVEALQYLIEWEKKVKRRRQRVAIVLLMYVLGKDPEWQTS